MDSRGAFFALIAATALVCVSSRAVNISNTWMLPEEGFPVFYRYFRDRISWYEADAVCQFHHANLVTVDSTSEYDSVRAYLKELDIVNNVWIGLSKNSEKAQFSWRDFRPLTNEGHWQEAIPVGNTPLCAATDPAADFGWHALPCGGSEVASFICELTVPSWSTGPKGCLLTELPSLTVLYLPEQSAIELTSDCGLDGTKRIACKGNADRDEMMRQLSCSITNDDFDDKTTRGSISESTIGEITNPSQSPNTKSTKPWIWTSNTISTGDYGTPTRHRRETENTFGPDSSTQSTADLKMKQQKISTPLDVTTIPSKIISATSKQMLEMATVNNVNDVTLDLSVTQKSSNPSEIIATVTQDSTTLKYNNKPEEQEESFSMAISTPNSNAQDGNLDEVGEYPGVINQGQLFSIIENGTMFDIIELNETGTEETRDSGFTLSQDNYKISSEIQSSTEQSLNSRALYTTIIYHKEPPEDINANNDRVKIQLKHDPTPTIKIFESKGKPNEKSSAKHKTLNDLLTKEDDKTLTKEIEMFPIVADSSIKLNRTYRKKLPMSESNLTKEEGEESYGNVDDFIIGDETSNHKVVEIKLHTDNNKSNIKTKLFVTTKLADKNKQVNKNGKVISSNVKNRNVIENKKDNIEKFDDVPINTIRTEGEEKEIEIDPRIEELNTRMINMSRNIDSEIISPIPFQETNLKTQFLPKSLLEESDEISKSPELIINDLQHVSSTIDNPTPDTLDSVPQQQPRPNRQRLLTKPQRRSFYPYFFSRVLG